MQRILIYVAALILTAGRGGFAQDARVEILIAASDPAIQEQLTRTYNAFLNAPPDDLKSNCEAFQELQKLKEITKDKGEIVKQLAIFVVTTTSEEDSHVIQAMGLLEFLDLNASIPIRVLAPYLGTNNPQLRGFARDWFQYRDKAAHDPWKTYKDYVRVRTNRNEEIPDAFVEYIYERHPAKALLVFAYGARIVDFNVTPQQRQAALRSRRETELSERIVSNAIWLKENDFTERFQAALLEAKEELAKLAKNEWWARLYVARIMQQHPELRDRAVMEQLRQDSNALVSKAAKSAKD